MRPQGVAVHLPRPELGHAKQAHEEDAREREAH
jgi:hypothetical protein